MSPSLQRRSWGNPPLPLSWAGGPTGFENIRFPCSSYFDLIQWFHCSIQGLSSPRLERRASVIESSTDTLVPEASEQGGAERSRQAESPTSATAGSTWTLGGSDVESNVANGSLPRPSLSQSLPLHQNRFALQPSSGIQFHSSHLVLSGSLKKPWRSLRVQMALLNPWIVMALLLTTIR